MPKKTLQYIVGAFGLLAVLGMGIAWAWGIVFPFSPASKPMVTIGYVTLALGVIMAAVLYMYGLKLGYYKEEGHQQRPNDG